MGSALEGIRILDLTSVVMGPILRAAAAVTAPRSSSWRRRVGMCCAAGRPFAVRRASGKYLHLMGKAAICLDLKQQAAREALLRVLNGSDVFVSDMRPDALARLGLDADSTRASRPRLIRCTITVSDRGARVAASRVMTRSSNRFGGHGISERRDGTPRFGRCCYAIM